MSAEKPISEEQAAQILGFKSVEEYRQWLLEWDKAWAGVYWPIARMTPH